MKGIGAFRTASAVLAAMRAAVTAFRNDSAEMLAALNKIGPYEPKRKTGATRHPQRTTRRDQRSALKKRNRRRNRLAHRRHGK